MYLILSKLGHVWFSNTITRLARLSQPKGVKIKQQPYIIRTGDGYKVKYYKREVLITLVSVLNIMPLAIIHAVMCVYNKWLKVKCFIS